MTIVNTGQAELWNTDAGQTWVVHHRDFDALLGNVLTTLITHASPREDDHVLDIGCGAGTSSTALAELVGAGGHVTGLDISAPLLDLARQCAAGRGNLIYVHGDAQVHPFAEASVDLVISRFGVMFFDNPVAAFANLRRAARPGGRLAMICWQGARENPWFMVPMRAAMDRLGKPAPMDPHAPGPMAFKDVDRVTGILRDAGWAEAQGVPVEVDLIPPQPLERAAEFAAEAGFAARLMRERNGTEADAAAIRAACIAGFARYQDGGALRIPARLIVYKARNPG